MSPRAPRDPRALLPLPAHDLHILLAILGSPRHGYAILQAIAAATDDSVQLGTSTLYAALKRMLAQGLITETGRPAADPSDDARRRYYEATPFGHAVAREAAREVERLHTIVRRSRLLDGSAAPRRARS